MESYKLKFVRFFNREVPVVLQSENGPCPLLAIVNVLLLRNAIEIPSQTFQIDAERLMSILADHLLQSNPVESSSRYAADLEQNLQDAMLNMPKLMTGVDVNPKFNSIHGFEFTTETAIFDLVDISLVHGWLMNPEEAVAETIGEMTYNQVAAKIISVLGSSTVEQKEDPPLIDMDTVVEVGGETEGPLVPLSDPVKCELKIEGDRIRLEFNETEWRPKEAEEKPEDCRRWEAVRDWLDSHSSQLTPYGLDTLHRQLPDRQLAVFFRNNHFSTIFRDKTDLYLLVTDQGYLAENDLVWEKLETVNNNNRFYTSSFRLFEGTSVKQDQNVTGQDSELQYALALSMENENANSSALPNDFLMVGSAPKLNQSDSDLALALQLQEDEALAQSQNQVTQQARGRGRGMPQSGGHEAGTGSHGIGQQHAFPPARGYGVVPPSHIPVSQNGDHQPPPSWWGRIKRMMMPKGT